MQPDADPHRNMKPHDKEGGGGITDKEDILHNPLL